jgi:hypothetical protein
MPCTIWCGIAPCGRELPKYRRARGLRLEFQSPERDELLLPVVLVSPGVARPVGVLSCIAAGVSFYSDFSNGNDQKAMIVINPGSSEFFKYVLFIL